MSDIGKIGHVVRIEKNTLDLLGEIKKSAGIPKYKTISLAVQYFYDNNEELETLIELDSIFWCSSPLAIFSASYAIILFIYIII